MKRLVFSAFIAATIFSTMASADAKRDCALVINSLGYKWSKYSFKEAGIFAKEQHIFDNLICYVTHDGKFHSLYKGDTPIAEDGYYGEEAIRKKAFINEKAEVLQRDAESRYKRDSAAIFKDRDDQLADLKSQSDPFNKPKAETGVVDDGSMILESEATGATPMSDESDQPSSSNPLAGGLINMQEVSPTEAPAHDEKWVIPARLNIRSCPATSCGITGWMTNGNKVSIFEENGEWSRISERLNAMCEGGVSAAIDSGNKDCSKANGIEDGLLARWVLTKHLSIDPPAPEEDPKSCSSGFLVGSDNYKLYSSEFCIAALKLVDSGKCGESDIENTGGWMASPAKGDGHYFTYCGGLSKTNRYYLDVGTGRIYQ